MGKPEKLFYERPASTPEVDEKLGPIIGEFVVRDIVKTGEEHPRYVRAAWANLPLPIRRGFFLEAYDQVSISTYDGMGALRANKASSVSYWEAHYGGEGELGATFDFDISDGEVRFYKEEDAIDLSPRSRPGTEFDSCPPDTNFLEDEPLDEAAVQF